MIIWHHLSSIHKGGNLVELLAVTCDEGISCIARWQLQADQTWHVSALTTESQRWEEVLFFPEEEVVPPSPPILSTGISNITWERYRQISKEGWTHEHDEIHTRGELIDAALSYLRAAINPGHSALQNAPREWPWAKEWWKPSNDPIRDLTKAGALIAAEIDRLQRLKAPHSHAPAPEHTPHSS